ncbi:hypothetical protein [Haladaptatus sp. DYF46]|uniref:hypothetical protein n=1 Tax=Haladaptatus sp. DYF46 TaxID=2886041 RepID=UPI001E3BC95B
MTDDTPETPTTLLDRAQQHATNIAAEYFPDLPVKATEWEVQHCERFTAPKWWLVCKGCGGRSARYRRSKTVRNPEQYCCSECGGSFRVEDDSH